MKKEDFLHKIQKDDDAEMQHYNEIQEQMYYEKKLSLFKDLPASKKEIDAYVQKVKENILNGEFDALDVKLKLKVFSEIIKSLEKDEDIKDFVISEAEKYEKSFEYLGNKFTLQNRSTYDFETCKDSEWSELQTQLKALKEKIKERENLLKSLKAPIADAETGEIIYPPAKKTNTILNLTLKK